MRGTGQAFPTLKSVPLTVGWCDGLEMGDVQLWGSGLGQAIKELLLLQQPH